MNNTVLDKFRAVGRAVPAQESLVGQQVRWHEAQFIYTAEVLEHYSNGCILKYIAVEVAPDPEPTWMGSKTPTFTTWEVLGKR